MKKILLMFSLIMSLLSFNGLAQSDQTKAEIRANIDWLNGQTGAPTRASTYLRTVPIGEGYMSVRGPLSARSCLNYATIFALQGQNQYAIQWLQAGQDHNQGVQQLFAQNPDYCVSYIKATYSNQAAVSFGLGQYAEWVSTAAGEIKKHNPRKEDAPKEPTRPVEHVGHDRH